MKLLASLLAYFVVWSSGIRFYETSDECPANVTPFREAQFTHTLEGSDQRELRVDFKFYKVDKDYYTYAFGAVRKKTHTLYMICSQGNETALEHYPRFMSLRVISTKVTKMISDQIISNIMMNVYASILRNLNTSNGSFTNG